jgi:hypothetical protein
MITNLPTKVGVCTLAAALLVGMTGVPAHAKDVCVQDGFGVLFVFKKVKALKKPGQSTPLHGVVDLGGGAVGVVSGSAYVRSDSVVEFGIFAHTASPTAAPVPTNFTASLEGDADYNASGAYDNDGDHKNENLLTWTPVDCKSVTLP